jgi:transposase
VCEIDTTGRVLAECIIEHRADAVNQLIDRLIERAGGQAARVAVAIELPSGLLVETLLEREIAVFSINPKQLDRFRDRFTAAGAKDDRRDARVLADSLRTDRRAFRRVVLDCAEIVQLREQSRMDEELTAHKLQLSNRLRDQLLRYFPQILAVGGSDEAWVWQLWELAPTPQQAARLKPAQVGKILRQHRIRRHTSHGVLDELKAPAFGVAPGVPEAACAHIEMLLPQLRLLDQQQQRCRRLIREMLENQTQRVTLSQDGPKGEPSDAEILLSLPGIGDLVGATMLTEASHALGDRDLNTLGALCGSAPVTKTSGKARYVIRRYACNERLLNATFYWGQSAAVHDPRTKAHYAQLRAAGHNHARAVRGVVSRLLPVLIAMLRDRSLYDATRRSPKVAA